MKLLLTSALIVLATAAVSAAPAVSPPAPAAAPSTQQVDLARKFVNIALPPERFMELMRAGAASGLSETLAGLKDESAQAEGEADLQRLFAQIEPAMKAQLPRVTDAYANAYAREYSAAELTQMIAFAQTPAGQHYLSRRDFVELDPAVVDAQMKIFEAIGPALGRLQREKCAEHTAQRIAAGDKKATCPLSKAAETRAG